MTREEAIEKLEWLRQRVNEETYRAVIMAIKSLEQEPCDDAINRRFEKIVVEYPTICTYPEYQGKPYFSIQYEENGEHIVGYGTYKPEVLTRYIKEYFIPSVTQKYTVFHCPKCGYQDTREL